MNDETRAAVERLLKLFSASLDRLNVDGLTMQSFEQKCRNEIKSFRKLLTEHPADDDTAVTVEWLEAVGFTDCGTHAERHGLQLWNLHISDVLEAAWSDSRVFPGAYRTRGDVRRLCNALGIELNERKCTCPTLDGIKVTGSTCPKHGLPDAEDWNESEGE